MFIRLVSTHKLKIKFLKVFLTRSFLFIQDIELTHRRWHSWVIVEDNYCDKMRHLHSDHSLSVKIFPSVSCRQNVAHNTLIVLHKYLHHLFPSPAGNSWERASNCQIVIERAVKPPLMKLTMTAMTLTLSLTPWIILLILTLARLTC